MRTLGPNQGLLEGRRVSTGTVRGLTVLVEFQDVTSTVTAADVSAMLNDSNYTANGNFCSVREYYRLVSNGKLDYSNDVVGPFKLSRNRQHYVGTLLVKEALDLAVASGVDLTRFDSLHEGVIDAVNFLYAGQTQYLGDLWPHNSFISLQYGAVRTNLYMLSSMGRNSADLSIGTFCHESGHLLCRFPDMYDYGNRDGDGVESAGIGSYCLMGSGNHLNHGRTPSPVCGYLRELAGWCDTIVPLNQAGNYEAVHGAYGTLMKFDTDRPNEYFIVENRSKLGLDLHLPASGLAVYHCDTRGSNEWQEGSASRHYQCALLQADGHLDMEHNINQGDGTDLFGNIQGTALSHATSPSSRRWDGADSGLLLSTVGTSGPTMPFVVGLLEPSTNVVRGEALPGLTIPDNQPAGIRSTITLAAAGTVRQVSVSVDITHTYVGDLEVVLLSPSGAEATLHHRSGGGGDNLVATYDASSVPALAALAGQTVEGDWVLQVRDAANRDVGKLNRWAVEIGIVPAEGSLSGEASPGLAIPDNDPAGAGSSISLSGSGTVRHLKVSIDITHSYIGDLRIELLSPTGRRAVLHSRIGGGADDLLVTYETSAPSSPLLSFVGQPCAGPWVLRVADLAGRDVGTLNSWRLELTTAE
jgi:M6 family metalloprotease-like protein